MKILHVVGARPNFMKAAPVMEAIEELTDARQMLVHTGQHYDRNMSQVFFVELGLRQPDINLEVGSASHAVQTAEIMTRFEQVVLQEQPDWVLVYGDVNSTVAAALVSAKLRIPFAHVEAGLRSFDRRMPEEVNRLVTDQLANLLFTPSYEADENLRREGIPEAKIARVGNVMIDTLIRLQSQAREQWPRLQSELALDDFGLVTLHRPSNVDQPARLRSILTTLNEVSEQLPLVFPVHPRTREKIEHYNLRPFTSRMYLLDPVSYLNFLALQEHATFVVTDSGGIQEETTYLGVPCLTLRDSTERPITVEVGTNQLVGHDMERLKREISTIIRGQGKTGEVPPLWEGQASRRIADVLFNQ